MDFFVFQEISYDVSYSLSKWPADSFDGEEAYVDIFYTEDYATYYLSNKKEAIEPYVLAAKKATELGLGINAGHDLSLENLQFFAKEIQNLAEVSIGHALISDAIYLGLENTIQMYKRLL